jgi:hypothetical protein
MLPILLSAPLVAYHFQEPAAPISTDLSDLKNLPLTSNQKAAFMALEKSGYKRVRVTSDGGEDDKYVTLDPPGSDFKIFVYVSPQKMRFQREVPAYDAYPKALERAQSVVDRLPGTKAKIRSLFGDIKITLEFTLPDSETTVSGVTKAIETLGRGVALLEKPEPPAPKPTPSTPEPADLVGKALKASGLSHTDIGRFYKIKYDYSDTKRSQTAHIRKEVYDYNSLKVQEIFSQCYDSPNAPSAELLQKVFQKRFSIGGLVLEAPSQEQPNWRIRFRIDAPIEITPDRLKQYVNIVAGTADTLEKELAPEDKL